jgi:hypothetical protein
MGELRLRTTTRVVDGKRMQRHECPLPITAHERELTARLDKIAAEYGFSVRYYDRATRPWWRLLGGSTASVAEMVCLSSAGAVAPARPRPAFRIVAGGGGGGPRPADRQR